MKKLVLASAIALMAISCSDNNPTSDQEKAPISFSNSVAQTKAIMSDTKIKDANISLYGFSDSWADLDVFDKEVLVANANGDLSYSNVKYYDFGKTYNFYAIYPAIGEQGVTEKVNASNAPTIEIDCAQQPDILYAEATAITKDKNPVALSFSHKLAQIKLTIKSEVANISATAATITAISGANMDLGTGSITAEGTAADFTIPGVVSTDLTSTAKQIGEIFMLPVQNINEVKVTLNSVETPVAISGLVLAEGKTTTIEIAIKGTEISFTQSVGPWVVGGTDGSGSVSM